MSFISIIESSLVLLLVTFLHYILFKLTEKFIRPKLPSLLGLNQLDDNLKNINIDLQKLNFPPIKSIDFKDYHHYKEDLEIDKFKFLLFDISISNSIHLIILTILNSTLSINKNSIFGLDFQLTINLLVFSILYLTPMLFIWNKLKSQRLIEKILTLVLYCIGTFISSLVIIKGIFKLNSLNLIQVGVYVIDIIGISSIAIINLLTCCSGIKRFFQWYNNKDPIIFENKSIELIDLLSDSPNIKENLQLINILIDDLNSFKKGKKSIFIKIYWGYCFIRGIMWIITILSILNISLTNLSDHKRDKWTNEFLSYFLKIDESFIGVLVSLISIVMNMMSTYKLIKLGDHLLLMNVIVSVSTLLAIT